MGNRGDELGLHALRLLDFQGHVVDGVDQVPDLIVKFFFDLDAVGPSRDALGGVGDHAQGLHDGADKIEVGKVHHRDNDRPDGQGDGHDDHHLLVHLAQRGDHPHHAPDAAVIQHGGGGGHDALPGLRGTARPGADELSVAGQRLVDILCAGIGAGQSELGRGVHHGAGLVQVLELQYVFLLKALHRIPGGLEIGALGVADGVGKAPHLGLQAAAHGGVEIPRNGHGKGRHSEQDDEQDGGNTVEHPALSNSLDLRHMYFHLLSPAIPGAGAPGLHALLDLPLRARRGIPPGGRVD